MASDFLDDINLILLKGGVGDDDVTFDVDMMEEESDGGDNSDEDEEDDDDDLDPPSGGEEQPLMHMDQGGNTRAGASQPNTVSGSSHDRRIENLQSPTIGGRPQADLSRPHSPAMDTTHATIGSTGELCKSEFHFSIQILIFLDGSIRPV